MTDSAVTHLLSRGAKAAHNHVATLRSIGQFVDDPELSGALAASTSALQVLLERAVTSARIELGEYPSWARIELGALAKLAVRRAAHEGHATSVRALDDPTSAVLPGAWAERLACDLVHLGTAIELPGAGALVVSGIDLGRWAELEPYLMQLAAACDCSLALDDQTALLRLPPA